MKKILITGACGQIGSELVFALAQQYGSEHIFTTDIQRPPAIIREHSEFIYLNVVDKHSLARIVVEKDIDTIFHMAAILSATGEKDPKYAYDVNMTGLINVLEVARKKRVERVITPSSIAVFGPDAPKNNTPNETPLNPTTMYGVTKVAGEKLLQYYYLKYGLDARSLRYPGIISSETAPGGGTTDFAVDLYLHAVQNHPYACFISEDTPLPFMYMPDAIDAIIKLAGADNRRLQRRVYNVHAMSLTPREIVASIQHHLPEFRCTYAPDFRQAIADSWPNGIDDSAAREEWGWSPAYDLPMMTRDMIERIRRRQS
ncbi:MAG: NAD-dependent epimerase/dehydratase family protein [Calditrichae bacterium]|nr:NAD-dependent epimerase/dehydratase family protein [Calditrichota bacterium]MCB9088036.1 NAD-dependent epimerase/dehydratase family protein [Calditrichia bacterium]